MGRMVPVGGRGKGRGRGTDGPCPWDVNRRGRGGGKGKGRGRGSSPGFYGHDTRHVIRSDTVLKPRHRPQFESARGRGFRGRGGRHNRSFEDRDRGPAPLSHPVQRVDEDNLGRHCEVLGAHTGAIHAMAMAEQGIYTASADKSLKRWKPVPGEGGRFKLEQELTIPLPDGCFSLHLKGDWLFCGLFDGRIVAFNKTGDQKELVGHKRRVTAMLVHQNILITGAADREVRLWQFDAATSTFRCTHTLADGMPGPIFRLCVLGEHLFVGGHNGIAMVHLASLTATKQLPPNRPIADFLEFQGHVIVAYSDGSLRIFDPQGTMKSELPTLAAGPILSLAGLESGPRVLCGHNRGQISTITLPSFEFKTHFQALAGPKKVESILCANQDGIFLIGAFDGTLQLWQRIGA